MQIEGFTRCPLCELKIAKDAEKASYPSMVWNQLDPLTPISDAIVHVQCLKSTGLLAAAERRRIAVQAATGPGKRECRLCHQQIMTPDEHVVLGYLTDDANSPLQSLNLAQFHHSCLKGWVGLPKLIADLEAANSPESWRGTWLEFLIRQLKSISDE